MIAFRSVCAASALVAVSLVSPAAAVPLDTLLGGGTLSAGGVTFSGFTFSDFSHAGDAGDVEVEAYVIGNRVGLDFSFLELFSDPGDESFIGGNVTATITDPNLVFAQQSLSLGRFAHDFDAFLSQVSASTDALFVSSNPGFSSLSDSGGLGGTVYSDAWDARTENTGGGFGTTSLSGITWTFDLQAAPATVPLPASVLMLGAGLAGLGALRRRKRS